MSLRENSFVLLWESCIAPSQKKEGAAMTASPYIAAELVCLRKKGCPEKNPGGVDFSGHPLWFSPDREVSTP